MKKVPIGGCKGHEEGFQQFEVPPRAKFILKHPESGSIFFECELPPVKKSKEPEKVKRIIRDVRKLRKSQNATSTYRKATK